MSDTPTVTRRRILDARTRPGSWARALLAGLFACAPLAATAGTWQTLKNAPPIPEIIDPSGTDFGPGGATAPLLDPSGAIAGSLGIFVDLSERKRAEAMVRQLNETLERRVHERTARLEEANEELQAFFRFT